MCSWSKRHTRTTSRSTAEAVLLTKAHPLDPQSRVSRMERQALPRNLGRANMPPAPRRPGGEGQGRGRVRGAACLPVERHEVRETGFHLARNAPFPFCRPIGRLLRFCSLERHLHDETRRPARARPGRVVRVRRNRQHAERVGGKNSD